MERKHAVKIIKNGKRKVAQISPPAEPFAGPNRWSKTVASWVRDFQKHRGEDALRKKPQIDVHGNKSKSSLLVFTDRFDSN